MKICVAQTRPVKADIKRNISNHKKLIALAVAHAAEIIIFPELSITGYEPALAKESATGKDDSRFDDFQKISDDSSVTIGLGMPVKTDQGILIGMIIFQPRKPRQVYCKQHLHSDEYPYFISGREQVFLSGNKYKIALSICYELSVPEHAENAFKAGADIYIASVAKTADGVEKAGKALSVIAKKYSMTVLMSNCTGHCDNFESAGTSSVWNNKGVLAGQLDTINAGILIFDTDTQRLTEKTTVPAIH
jgi:predicted amidohydrolase